MNKTRDTELYIIIAENFHLDGGACFGVVPKSIWSKLSQPDENNLLPISSRCLLVRDEDRLILIDTGIGKKQKGKFIDFFYLFGDGSLENSFAEQGLDCKDVTDVLHTHLHFDHCGGSVKYNADRTGFDLTFPNANYWCSKAQWEWAMNPNAREKASYLKENLQPILESGKLTFIEKEGPFSPHIYIRMFNGHTDGQIIPHITHNGKTIVFMADFIPTAFHIPLPYVAGYDTRPLLSMKEKEEFLNEAGANHYILFFEHDYQNEACTLERTEKGFRPDKIATLGELLAQ
jgi:glyoxylase-like metal-dependent hydrolase (beta-lactamase superfamily II)